MRLRVDFYEEVVDPAHERVFAHCQGMELGVIQCIVTLAHRTLNGDDRMAHNTSKARLRFRSVHDLSDGRIHHAAEKQGWIMAARAPLRWPRAHHILHVLEALPVPLVVERGEVVCRAVPLFKNIGVAAFARGGLHEEPARDETPVDGLSRAWEERTFGPIAFAVHGRRRN